MGACFLLALLSHPAALGATWSVEADGTGDYDSIQAAIDAAEDGDLVLVGPGTYTGRVDFGGKALEVASTDGPESTVIDPAGALAFVVRFEEGEGADSVLDGFTISNEGEQGIRIIDSSPTLRNLVLTGLGSLADEGGAVFVDGGAPAFEGVQLSSNLALRGAHLYISGGAAVTVVGGSFADGLADDEGGAIYLEGYASTLGISDSGFERNLAYLGGAIALYGGSLELDTVSFTENYADWEAGMHLEQADATLIDVSFTDNSAYGQGGIYLVDASLVAEGLVMTGNDGGVRAGAIGMEGGSLHISDAILSENQGGYASGPGGGMLYVGHLRGYAEVTITDSVIDDNYSSYGGGAIGVRNIDATLTLTRVSASGNTAERDGGFLQLYTGSVVIEDSDFSDNHALSGDGGVISSRGAYEPDVADLVIVDSTFQGNSATDNGGAVKQGEDYATSGNLSISGSYFLANTALHGGAVFFILDSDSEDSATVQGSTFCANTAGSHGGAVWLYGRAALTNNVLQGNRAARGGGVYASAGPTSLTRTQLINNSFVANAATSSGGAVLLANPVEELTNNIFAFTRTGGAVTSVAESSSLRLGYNDWFGNVGGHLRGDEVEEDFLETEGTQLFVPPGFRWFSADGECNDNLRLRSGSSLVDAGDPDLEDPDGSRSDVGAYGGPGAD